MTTYAATALIETVVQSMGMVAVLPERIVKHQAALEAVCERYGVERLDLFGSAATGSFDPEHSDLDFVVVFTDESGEGLADRYLDLAEALELLFARPVDLLTERSIRNPIFRQSVEHSRQELYERSHPQVLA